MTEAWVDANVILRHLTKDPPEQAADALALFRAAEEGRVALRVDAITIAECVWVLTSFYGHGRVEVADALAAFVSASGIVADDVEVLAVALQLFAAHNVDFADAFLAARMAQRRVPTVYSFDRDSDRLPGTIRLNPADPGAG
jgi:predicted nucleic acid-binding protein